MTLPGSTVEPDTGSASLVSSHTPATAVLVIVQVASSPSASVTAAPATVAPVHVHWPAS